jgi:hypothetical protein
MVHTSCDGGPRLYAASVVMTLLIHLVQGWTPYDPTAFNEVRKDSGINIRHRGFKNEACVHLFLIKWLNAWFQFTS